MRWSRHPRDGFRTRDLPRAAAPRARRIELVSAQGNARRGRDPRADRPSRGCRGDRAGGPDHCACRGDRVLLPQSGTRIHKTVHYYLMEPTGGDLDAPRPRVPGRALGPDRRGRGDQLPHRARDRGPRLAVAGVDEHRPSPRSATDMRRTRARRAPPVARRAADRFRRLGDAGPVPDGHPRRASRGPRASRAVRPVAHGRALGQRTGCRRRRSHMPW